MEIRRFYVNADDIQGDAVTIRGDEFLHMTKVLRHKPGYKIIVNNNSDGIDYYAEIISIGSEAKAKIYKTCVNPVSSSRNITLMQALPKGDKSDFIAMKATELGVRRILFFKSDYSEEKKPNIDRLRKIAVEACKQCGRAFVPEVELVKTEDLPIDGGAIFFNEREKRVSFSEVELSDEIGLIVGPEGGFSEREAKYFISEGAVSVSLGKRILRAETASIAAMTLAAYKAGELDI